LRPGSDAAEGKCRANGQNKEALVTGNASMLTFDA
jgi:hypothetical protein